MNRGNITISLLAPNGISYMVPNKISGDVLIMCCESLGSFLCNNHSIEINKTSWDPDELLEYSKGSDYVFKVVCEYDGFDSITKLYYHGKYQLIDTYEFHEEYLVPAEYCGGPERRQLFGWSTAEFFDIDDVKPIPMVGYEPFVVVSKDLNKIKLACYNPHHGWNTDFDVKYWRRIK